MVATPNLTLTITPPGGTATDYSRYLAWSGTTGQNSISQNFGRQGDTAQLVLVEEYATTPSVVIRDMSQVKLYDNNISQTLFAGVITKPTLHITSPNRNEWLLDCTDYTWYADNALVRGQYYGWTVDQIVVDLVKQANCGITAAPVSAGGFVAPGPQLASFILNWATLSKAWRRLSVLAGQVTPFGWYVDEQLRLHFYDATSAISSGVTFTTAPTIGGSSTEGHILLDSQNAYEWDGTSVRNRILVQGATQTITVNLNGAPTDTWRADGTQQSWPLRYTLTGSPKLLVGGVQQAVTVVSGGGTATGAWVAEQNSVGGWFLSAAAAPAAGTTIEIWYSYEVPVAAQANDYPSQQTYTGPNGGIYAEFISDSSLTTAPMALARAMRERQEYAFAAERATFNSSPDWIGWVRAGQTITYNNQLIPDTRRSYALGVTGTFIVIGNRVQVLSTGGYRQAQITAIRL